MVEKGSTHLNEELSSLKTYLFRPAMEIFASSFRRTILSHMTTSLRIYSIKQILVNHSVYSDRRPLRGWIERKYRTSLYTTVLGQCQVPVTSWQLWSCHKTSIPERGWEVVVARNRTRHEFRRCVVLHCRYLLREFYKFPWGKWPSERPEGSRGAIFLIASQLGSEQNQTSSGKLTPCGFVYSALT